MSILESSAKSWQIVATVNQADHCCNCCTNAWRAWKHIVISGTNKQMCWWRYDHPLHSKSPHAHHMFVDATSARLWCMLCIAMMCWLPRIMSRCAGRVYLKAIVLLHKLRPFIEQLHCNSLHSRLLFSQWRQSCISWTAAYLLMLLLSSFQLHE